MSIKQNAASRQLSGNFDAGSPSSCQGSHELTSLEVIIQRAHLGLVKV